MERETSDRKQLTDELCGLEIKSLLKRDNRVGHIKENFLKEK